MLSSFSREALFHEVVVAPRRAHVPLPDTQVIDRPDWMQLVTPSLRDGGLNEVALAVLDEAEADAVIDRTIEGYRALGIRFRWSVGPDSRPLDLAERLARRGLERSETRGMFRSTSAVEDVEPTAITVEEVDLEGEPDFTQAMAEGWAMDSAPLARFHRAVLERSDSPVRLFLARWEGEPAGTAGQACFERSAYLMGGVVLPAFRGRGVYRALVASRLRDAASRGLSLATSHARSETSAPILERMGFSTLCTWPMFSCAG